MSRYFFGSVASGMSVPCMLPASAATWKYRNKMQVMDSCPGQGASRSEGCVPSQGLQRRHGCEGALSWFDIFGLQY
jgi:hypothetical protein